MAEAMIDTKKTALFPQKQLSRLHSICHRDSGKGISELHHANKEYELYSKINLNGGCTSRYVTSTVVSDNNRHLACERSQKLKQEGNTLKACLLAIKAFMTLTKMNIEAATEVELPLN